MKAGPFSTPKEEEKVGRVGWVFVKRRIKDKEKRRQE